MGQKGRRGNEGMWDAKVGYTSDGEVERVGTMVGRRNDVKVG